MGKTNGATTTKPKAKESPKAPAKPDRKVEKASSKVEKAEKVDKAEKNGKAAAKPAEKAKSGSDRVKAVDKPRLDVKAVEIKAGPEKSRGKDAVKESNGVELKKYKCPFPSDELAKWREALLQRRSEISSDIAGLVKDAMEAEDGHTTPNHIAERGSDADLQDMSLGMAGEEEVILWQIDRAIRKIDKGVPLPYGLCEFSKEPISRSRLQLIPWTPLSIEGATHMEQDNLQIEDLLLED